MARNLNLKYISNRRLQRDIHEKFSGGFSDVMRGGVLLKSLWIFSVLVVLLICVEGNQEHMKIVSMH